MLRYLVGVTFNGVTFNAKSEIDALVIKLADDAKKSRRSRPQLWAVIDIIESLTHSRDVGFEGIKHKWSQAEHDDLFLYSDIGVMGAMNVPGNGRGQTYDLGLVGSTHIEQSDVSGTAAHIDQGDISGTAGHETAFAQAMSARRKGGTYNDWP
jgi:hypothetical protein